MNKLNLFIENLCGIFSNDKQIEFEKKKGKIEHPKAKHINGICNSKIKNLPKNFKGYFIIEESYYEKKFEHKKNLKIKKDSVKTIEPHLFLFTENEKGKIVLNSYEIPSDIAKQDFRNDNKHLELDYNELNLSKKFTPIIYNETKDGEFVGEGESDFAPGVKFILKEKILKDILIVSEILKKDGHIIFGWEDPIIYIKE
ncbi:hypothetical protein [Clostridium tarantellae]|uniref:Uncharacterized protein n=1 Tax=Clostridium tarantellae TaxID=39493 RepID=A0A6I1MPK5_9CLOT|nr:hypothetical protein [Clostridium tarantellae]MPQ44733.1 hypothetical protein [Clostridium tarantellae]